MELVRKLLSADEVQAPGTRYDETCDCVQVTSDDGVTWNDAPGLDPRSQPGYLLPGRGGTDPRCDSAANMVAVIRNFVDTLTDGSSVYAVATLLMELIGAFLPLGLLVALVVIVASAIVTIGIILLQAAMTEGVYDQLLCIFYANTETDGTLSPSGFADIYAAVDVELEATAAGFTKRMLDLVGYVGLSNMGATGTETGDCGECAPWCYTFDFTVDDGGWTALGTSTYYVAGSGWKHDPSSGDPNASVIIVRAFSSRPLQTLQCVYTGSINGQDIAIVRLQNGSANHDGAGGSPIERLFNPIEASGTAIWVGGDSVNAPNSMTITSITLTGTSGNPFGADNCP